MRVTIVCLCLTMCLESVAQQLTIRNFSAEEYSSGTQNWDIAMTAKNDMLFANNQGLLTFDSEEWATYPVSNYSTVRTLCIDEKRLRIYVGASDELGYFTPDSLSGALTYHSLTGLLKAEYASFDLWRIYRVGSEVVFLSKSELMVYSPERNTMRVISSAERIEGSAVVDARVVVAGRSGAYELKNDELVPLKGTEALSGRLIVAVMKVGSDIVFATANDGLFRYDGKRVETYEDDILSWCRDNQIFCATANERYLAIGTVRGGLLVKNLVTQEENYVNAMAGLQNNTILSVAFDHLDNVWLGLDNGISYVVTDTPYKSLLTSGNHIGTGYVSQLFAHRLYLGTNQGLFYLPYPMAKSPSQPTPERVGNIGGQIWCMSEVDGKLLCGADNGVYEVSGTMATRIDGTQGTWALCRLKHRPDYVLGIDYSGLYVLKRTGGNYVFANRVEGFTDLSNTLVEDTDGSVWISHWRKGIFHLTLTEDLRRVESMEVYNGENQLATDDNNTVCVVDNCVYISSHDGFYRLDKESGRLVNVEWMDRVFPAYSYPLMVEEAPNKDLIAYKRGFLAIAKRTKGDEYDVDTLTLNGLKNLLHMDLGKYSFLDASHCLFNANDGYILADLNKHFQATRSKVSIRRVASIVVADSTLYNGGQMTVEQIVVPKRLNSLRFEFVCEEYRKDHAVSYECLLEKYDQEWSMPQTATYKEYTPLAKGTYTFHVRATNLLTGELSEASMSVRVLPAWYETNMACVVYALMVILLVYYAIWRINRRAAREVERMRTEMLLLKNEQLEIDLKHKSGEIADTTINLIRKNDMLQSIDEDMEELSARVRTERSKDVVLKKINDIRHNIRLHKGEDENWDKFEENFNLVYDDFMKKIIRRFPNIKKNERKLCAYLRMGLSSKEMASLLNTSVRSIETARYRLRKKLNLSAHANLKDFLQEIDQGKET